MQTRDKNSNLVRCDEVTFKLNVKDYLVDSN